MAVDVVNFSYRGRDGTGKEVKGNLEAPNYSAVVSRMRAMGLVPLEIKEAKAGGLNADIKIPGMEKGVGLKDLALMSRQLATMINAGVPLIRSLNIALEQIDNPTLKKAMETVRTEVETGSALSDALQRQSRHFPPIMINLIRAGEAGGFLDQSLEAIAANFEREVQLRAKIKSALTYPTIVLVIAVLAVIAMLLFVVPVFETMFSGMGQDLPLPTQILVVLSKAMPFALPILVVAFVVFWVWWSRNKNEPRVRAFVDPLKFRIPVFGALNKKLSIARFTRNFSTMIASGVPLLQSLAIVGDTSGNYVIQQALNSVSEAVRQGRSLAAPMAAQPVFPSMVPQMIAVGEDSGSLDTMLSKVADFYDAEVEATTEQLTALIEPIMVAFLGLIVGGMVVALYMPIFGIAGAVQGS